MIHFDTNFLIAATRAGSVERTQCGQWQSTGEEFGISSVAWAEYLCGPLDSAGERLARRLFQRPESLLPDDAELAAHLFNATGGRSRSLADCMISAVAIRCGARLATRNSADFQPFVAHGLRLA